MMGMKKKDKKAMGYMGGGMAKKTMGYKKGGDVKKKKVKEAKKKAPVSRVPGKTKTPKGKSLKELGMTPSPAPKIPGKLQSRPMNNTSAPKPPTPPQAAMGAAPAPMGGMAAPKPPMGMGMPPKKPPMPGMKSGGKVKKKAKSYGHGGKVRGAGIAKKGVKKCKMR